MDKTLLTELVVADMNIKSISKIRRISFNDEVRKAFKQYQINSYFDLIRFDMDKAKELRNLAVNEQLL